MTIVNILFALTVSISITAGAQEVDTDTAKTIQVCGYFNDFTADPDYNDWVNRQKPPTDVPMVVMPVERFTLHQKIVDAHGIVDFKHFDLVAGGRSSLVTHLRSSIIDLMEQGRQYCVIAQPTNNQTQLWIHSARKK